MCFKNDEESRLNYFMKILIKTKIEKNYQVLFSLFNIDLFKALKPPVMSLIVERFDGCKPGDEVHLRMDFFGFFKERWVSRITKEARTEYEVYFIDEGIVLPFPIKNWTHQHRIEKITELSSYVVDEIDYSSGNKFIDLLIYPGLFLMFLFRVPVYKRVLS